MTPKEKAKELFDEFSAICMDTENGYECALKAVNLVIIELSKNDVYHDYWDNVKNEINKL